MHANPFAISQMSVCQVHRAVSASVEALHSINNLIWASGFTSLSTNLVKIVGAKAEFSCMGFQFVVVLGQSLTI